MPRLKSHILMTASKAQRYLDGLYLPSEGYGEHKPLAVELLRSVTRMLDERGLTYFLISGTLLGYARHQDFIPWDDDIDLMVERRIFDLIPQLRVDYPDLHFICDNWMNSLKVASKAHGLLMDGTRYDHCLEVQVEALWPFADVFVYDVEEGNLRFFDLPWSPVDFLPTCRVPFLGMEVAIPANANHFLVTNFGLDYMTTFLDYRYDHKEDKVILKERHHEVGYGA